MTLNSELTSDCESIVDLIPEYAFGLTDEADTRRVEAGLSGCPEALAQLEQFHGLLDEMRADVPQVAPPPELGARLMAALAAETVQTPIPTPTPANTAAPAMMPAPVAAPQPRRAAIRLAWWLAAAAAVALIVTNVYWFTRVNNLTTQQEQLMAMVSSSQNAFVLNDTSNLHWVRLANTEGENDASAFMMWDKQSETGLLYARGMPELAPGEIYHLWLTRNGQRTFVGVFQTDPSGDGALLFHSPEPIDDFAWAWITAGSPEKNDAITNPAVVGGELSPT